MSTPNQNPVEASQTAQPVPPPAKARSVQRCNFRVAGRLSNEDVRALSAMHEIVAKHIAGAMDAYLATALDVRFAAVSETTAKNHVEELPPLSYVMPFASGLVMLEVNLDLVFPIIDLLMGGAGDAKNSDRDLSEIEEEIMQDIALLILREVEAVWAVPDLPLLPMPPIKPSMLLQSFRPSEKLTLLRFEMSLGTITGTFNLVLSTPYCDLLIKRIKEDGPQRKSRVWSFPPPPLRERILDCEMEVMAELPGLKVAVKDLVALQPGSVLKLRAPIRNPGMLTAAGRELFEAVPVRSGSQRAAQLGRRTHSADWKRR